MSGYVIYVHLSFLNDPLVGTSFYDQPQNWVFNLSSLYSRRIIGRTYGAQDRVVIDLLQTGRSDGAKNIIQLYDSTDK